MGTVDEQLERARTARATLQTLQEQSAQVEVLQQQVGDRDRLARARSVANAAEQQAWDTVNNVRPALEDWRQSFRDWTREGWRLLGDLRSIQSQLLPVLDVAVAGAAGLAQAETFRPGDLNEQVFLGQSKADTAVDQVLARLGTADLDPFGDDVPDGFPRALVNLCLQYLGRVYLPEVGRVQFQRRGGIRRG